MLAYILRVEVGPRGNPEEPPEEEGDPEEPPEQEEDPEEPSEEEEDLEEPPFPGSDHDYRLGPWQPDECEVIDVDPPPRPKMAQPAGIPWVGHHSDYDPNTWVYIQLEPLYPCPFKIRAQSAYLGPVRIRVPCYNGYYLIAVPPGFQEHYTDRIHYSRVARSRPEQEHRIITENADFTDHVTYTEIPIRLEPYNSPNPNKGQQEPLWRVTWHCYGLTEDTVEKQSLLEEHFPVLFD
ncbi:hypothetical protein RHGRI_020685 [Rhododendron griersonianum]|uniref:Uncharacterized protein n=1 Tax=Rhododendron griersonianum TaxID=479676 RepID=A0AAV6JKN8_9ERIC|nr:hypothetical protein RHGRI_020685 [Rhododendron griersonianum]